MKNKEKILEARKKALLAKLEKDEALMELHRNVVYALMDPKQKEFMLKKAHRKIDMWEERELCSCHYIKAWREILKKEGLPLKNSILRNDGDGIALRQNTPFGFFLNSPI